jgi:hypothetical protein
VAADTTQGLPSPEVDIITFIFAEDAARRPKLLTCDEARRIATNIASVVAVALSVDT